MWRLLACADGAGAGGRWRVGCCVGVCVVRVCGVCVALAGGVHRDRRIRQCVGMGKKFRKKTHTVNTAKMLVAHCLSRTSHARPPAARIIRRAQAVRRAQRWVVVDGWAHAKRLVEGGKRTKVSPAVRSNRHQERRRDACNMKARKRHRPPILGAPHRAAERCCMAGRGHSVRQPVRQPVQLLRAAFLPEPDRRPRRLVRGARPRCRRVARASR